MVEYYFLLKKSIFIKVNYYVKEGGKYEHNYPVLFI